MAVLGKAREKSLLCPEILSEMSRTWSFVEAVGHVLVPHAMRCELEVASRRYKIGGKAYQVTAM